MAATAIPSLDKACKRWGLACPFCDQSAAHPSPADSDWSEEDWDGNRKREEEGKTKEGRGDDVKTGKRRTRKDNFSPK